MARWKEMRAQQKEKYKGDDWPHFVLLSIDPEGNIIEAVSQTDGAPENEQRVATATAWWHTMIREAAEDPGLVHPLIHSLLNTKKKFDLIVDVRSLPR